MSYESERKIISNFLHSLNFFGLSPFGLSSEKVVEVAGAGYMTLLPGSSVVRSIAQSSLRVHHAGVLMVHFWVDGGNGEGEARAKADDIIASLFDRRLDENGTYPSAGSAMVIDFAFGGDSPYISSITEEQPFLRATVAAPFVRIENKSRN